MIIREESEASLIKYNTVFDQVTKRMHTFAKLDRAAAAERASKVTSADLRMTDWWSATSAAACGSVAAADSSCTVVTHRRLSRSNSLKMFVSERPMLNGQL